MNNITYNIETITLKYFEAGHSLMSADSFHHRVDKAAKSKINLFNYDDVEMIEQVGTPIRRRLEDFLE